VTSPRVPFPLPLQLAGDQTVFGLHPVVLSAGALDLVAGAVKPLAPELLQHLPLMFEFGKGGYGCVNPGQFDHLEKGRLYSTVHVRRGEGLAARGRRLCTCSQT
jgi:hypothetical protein